MQDDKILARLDALMDRLDFRFIEAAHYDRDESYRVDSPAQRPLPVHNPESKSNVEFYAPTTVSVLAYPTLYCMACATEHACAYTHKVDRTLGVCLANFHIVKPEQYEASVRVQATAEQSIGGTLSRT